MIITLQDQTGVMEALVFPEAFQKLEPILKPATPLLLKGKVAVEDAGTRLMVSEGKLLEQVAEKKPKLLRVRVELGTISTGTVDQLKEIFVRRPGRCRVEFESVDARWGRGHSRNRRWRKCRWRIGGRGSCYLRPECGRDAKVAGNLIQTCIEKNVKAKSRIWSAKWKAFAPSLQSPRSLEQELDRLRREVAELRHEFYSHLSAWQRLQLARHASGPTPSITSACFSRTSTKFMATALLATTRQSFAAWHASTASPS